MINNEAEYNQMLSDNNEYQYNNQREMKTPMQELLEWVKATLPMDLDTPRMIEQKIESMLEKEKEAIINAYNHAYEEGWDSNSWQPEQYYNETFNAKEK